MVALSRRRHVVLAFPSSAQAVQAYALSKPEQFVAAALGCAAKLTKAGNQKGAVSFLNLVKSVTDVLN